MTSSLGNNATSDADYRRRHVLICANPNAGAKSSAENVAKLGELLIAEGLEPNLITDLSKLREASTHLLQQQALRAVVAVGGDGTVGAVVNHTPPGAPIAVFPHGTENLLSKYVQVNCNAATVCDVIVHGQEVCLDAGQVGDRIFLLMVSCGLDADVVRRVDEARQGHIDHFTYAKPIFDSIRSYEYPPIQIHYETINAVGEIITQQVEAAWAFVMNVPRYAAGLQIVPKANATDGMLDICTFRRGSLLNGLMYLGGVLMQRHLSWKDCHAARTTKVKIESTAKVPYQLDGDSGGHLPIEIQVLPNRLTLLAPATWQSPDVPIPTC